MAKGSIATKVEDWSNGRMIGGLAVVLVVVLIVGFGLGFKVEQSRIRTKNKNAKKTALHAAKKQAAPGKKPAVGAAVLATGAVSATAGNVVTITPAKGPAGRFVVGKASLIVKTIPGTASDVAAGVRMFYKPGSNSTAREIVVLRGAQARMGSAVTSATSTAMTFKYLGKDVTVTTSGAAVETGTAATKADITKGAKAIVFGRRYKTGVLMTEIVVLPSSSAFG